MMELTEVNIKMDAVTLAAVQQALNVLVMHANTALAAIQSQVKEQVEAAAILGEPKKSNGHLDTAVK